MRRANLKTKIMNEAEKLLEKFARKNMIEWNQESFKKSHSRLHKSIIEAINEALRIHGVVQAKPEKVCVCREIVTSGCTGYCEFHKTHWK
jgi:hypothetical protein